MACGGELICDAQNITVQANPDIAGYGLMDKQPFRFVLAKLRIRHNTRQKLSRREREEALNNFILSLSDQQLATGLAILIAAVTNQCTLTPPDFRVAFALAWFSTTTHLATLDSLRQYFVQHAMLRNVRIIGMLAFMALFLYSFLVVLLMENSPDSLVPVQCHVQGSVKLYGDEEVTLSKYFVPWVMTVLFLIFEYKSALLRTYDYGANDLIGLGALSKNVLALWSRWRHPKNLRLPHMSTKEWRYVQNEFALESFAAQRRDLLEGVMQVPANTKHWRRLNKTYQYAAHRHWQSLLPLAFPMTFMMVYGFVQMLMFRLELGEINGIEFDSSMGFGQIIPLILLALPFLAAAELYSVEFSSAATGESTSAIEFTAINRTLTLPMTSSADVDDPELVQLEQNTLEYAAQLTGIQRYFYADTKCIQSLQVAAKTEQEVKEILKKKSTLLKATIEYGEAEQHMKGFSWVMALILFSRLSVAIIMPTLINLGKDSFSGTAGGFWIAALGAHRFYTWIRRLRCIKVERYVRLLEEYRAKKTSTAP
ncbi:hypothetical protein CFE70_006772 [Pyrenophora teres f. teres 0-1]